MAHAHSHGHAHPNGHGHGHSHAPSGFDRAFAVGIALNGGFVVGEIAAGLWANSLSLIADAGHNAADVLALVVAWAAAWAGKRAASSRFTYGWRRASILASLVNAVALLVAVGVIATEAAGRLRHPAAVETGTVIVVSAIGIAINGLTAWGFARGRKDDLNIRAAFAHMAGDAAVSAGVALAAVAMRFTGWLWLDPAASLAVAAIVLTASWGLLRESANLSMDAVPAGVDPAAVGDYLRALPGVSAAHHIHIWPISTTEIALTAHLVMRAPGPHDALIARICHDLDHEYGIGHATVQVEGSACGRHADDHHAGAPRT